MSKVKICGLTRLEDAQLASDLGAAYLGFIFAKSPRQLSPEQANAMIPKINTTAQKVGVFVNETAENIQKLIKTAHLDMLQLHGDESPEFCAQFEVPVIKAISVKDAADLEIIQAYVGKVQAILLDTKVPNQRGGTGKTFDWQLAIKASSFGLSLFLAGGITPANIADAIATVAPAVVDVSSGVEASPGLKSEAKLRALFSAL